MVRRVNWPSRKVGDLIAQQDRLLAAALAGSFALHATAAALLPGWKGNVAEPTPFTVRLVPPPPAMPTPQSLAAKEPVPSGATRASTELPAPAPHRPVTHAVRHADKEHQAWQGIARVPTALTHTQAEPIEADEERQAEAALPAPPAERATETEMSVALPAAAAAAPVAVEASVAVEAPSSLSGSATLSEPATHPAAAASSRASGEGPHTNVGYLYNPRPDYPFAARQLHLEGRVVLHVLVNENGRPEEMSIGQSSGAPILDQTALEKVRTWRFVPARHGDKAIAHWVNVPIRFHLED